MSGSDGCTLLHSHFSLFCNFVKPTSHRCNILHVLGAARRAPCGHHHHHYLAASAAFSLDMSALTASSTGLSSEASYTL